VEGGKHRKKLPGLVYKKTGLIEQKPMDMLSVCTAVRGEVDWAKSCHGAGSKFGPHRYGRVSATWLP